MPTEYDVILLGSGHNSLVLQAYLGMAGLRTLCLERRNVPGGGLATVRDSQGFLHHPHSFYHRALTAMPWYRNLDLANRGAHYIEPDLNVALILRDHRSLQWWTDFDRTADSFAQLSPRDAATLRRWRADFQPILDEILIPESQSPPLEPARRAELLNRTPQGRRLLEVSRLSPLEFVIREFENPVIQAGLLFFNGLREVDLRAPGFGHHIAALLAGKAKAQMCRGGAGQLAAALVRAVEETGGEIRLNTEPRRIHVRNGAVSGVETAGGDFIRTRAVASGLNPLQTFIDLFHSQDVPETWRTKAREFRFNLLAPLFAVNVNLSEAPVYTAAERSPELSQAFMIILGLEHSHQFPEIVRCHQQGQIPPTVMWGSCPSVFDPSQAPPGHHTAFWWEKLPYHLEGNPANWDQAKQSHGRHMLDHWASYAPNTRNAILHWTTQSPLDTERTLPNMREGDLLIGALSHGQVGYNRPFEGAGHYRGHVKGLYLCGGSSHPGGNVTGLPGYNCAQVLLADLDQTRTL
ncbi:MAG: NAD(P)/FAD-dependent oxidoreductase [Bryobacterales bacterium]|nr:NAD(P)/FAD-dependent oxidoreductase [Bryobacterales bacterium]